MSDTPIHGQKSMEQPNILDYILDTRIASKIMRLLRIKHEKLEDRWRQAIVRVYHHKSKKKIETKKLTNKKREEMINQPLTTGVISVPNMLRCMGGRGMRAKAMYLTSEQAEEAGRTVQNAGQFMLIHYGAIIDMANAKMRDVESLMREKGDYRFKKKHYYNESWKRIEGVRRLISASARSSDNEELLLDTFDVMMKDVDMQMMYWPIVQWLCKRGIADARYKAHFEVVITLLNFAMFMLRAINDKTVEDTGLMMTRGEFQDYDIEGCFTWWGRLCDEVLDYDGDMRLELLGDADVKRAIQVMHDRVTGGYYIKRAFREVAAMHPEAVEKGYITLDAIDNYGE